MPAIRFGKTSVQQRDKRSVGPLLRSFLKKGERFMAREERDEGSS
jgi:hypothetical protein